MQQPDPVPPPVGENKDLTGPLILFQSPAHQQGQPFKTPAQVRRLGRQTYPSIHA
jgi:hypothetical protein